MLRAELIWSGGPMGSGLTVLNFMDGETTDHNAIISACNEFAADIAEQLPVTVTVRASNIVEVRNDATGVLEDTLSGTALGTHTGAGGAGAYAAGVGARIRWQTAAFRFGRRVVGTTFVTPITSDRYEANGTLLGGSVTSLAAAGNTLIGLANTAGHPLGVWSKPKPAGTPNGLIHSVTGVTVPDQVAWLTSRRS